MTASPRQRFLSYVKDPKSSAPIVSPFLPHPDVIKETLAHLNLPVADDEVRNEIRLAQELHYEPMFMTECSELIFNWKVDRARSGDDFVLQVINTRKGEWTRQSPGEDTPWHDDAGCPVQSPDDHEMLVCVCEQVGEREQEIREYFRNWRRAVGDDGVIVLGHPHPGWLGYQISPSSIFYQWNDFRDLFIRSMDAVYEASLFVMSLALEEGIDFMSDSSYGLEMTSPVLFETMDLPCIQKFAEWTHARGSLFWYHNCGFTRQLIMDGWFNRLGADVIETIAPPPSGDNDLAESRRYVDQSICTKGNLSLELLHDGSPEEIREDARRIVQAVRGHAHIFSTADAVLKGTPPENFLTFVTSMQEFAPA